MSKIERQLNKIAKRTLAILPIKNSYADIILASPRLIQGLNRKFRRKNKPTNVLAFPYPRNFPQPKPNKIFLGEVYLCKKYIESRGEDIRYMLIHGVLHLLGFDHKKYDDRIRMEKLERKLYQRITNKSLRIY